MKGHLILYGSTLTYLPAPEIHITMVSESLHMVLVNREENPARFRRLLPALASRTAALGEDAAYSCVLRREMCQQLDGTWGVRYLVARWTMATAHVKSSLASDVRLTVQEPCGVRSYSPRTKWALD